MARELDAAYDPSAVEERLYKDWDAAGLFHAEADDEGEPFSIVIPPPNVTGSLHVGHALDNTIQDAIIRRERMRGRNAVWIPGTDHAGIATQMVVEKQLAAEGKTRHDLGREKFLERVWKWREESGGTILGQLRMLGCSLDWEREAFTFDDVRNVGVNKIFVELYEQGLIYRGNRLINWDPGLNTALSNIEVDNVERQGTLTYFTYTVVDSDTTIEVATTRPETMLGDTAIAVHPDDERYTDLVGQSVQHPFLDRQIPIIADDYVDKDFGSGAVKITPAHDHNDYAMAQRQNLEMINIFNLDATVNENGGSYEGLTREDARAKITEDLKAKGHLVKVEDYTLTVPISSRSKAVVEPLLSDQWFVKIRPLADAAIERVTSGETRFIPDRLSKPFLEGLENHYDWCISRQLWWGHRIPAWYRGEGDDQEIHVGLDAPEGDGWEQDEDVLDTWFSSQLWPMSVFGWPEETPEFKTWYPTSTLVTGYDINFFWVAKMVMLCGHFTGKAPFEIVHNHGLVRDESGKKMSKSFGNVINPVELIEEFGADATRFALLREAAPGTDVPLSREWVEGAKRFANKLWNATRFVMPHLDGVTPGELPADGDLQLEDRWILSRLAEMRATVDKAYDEYEWSIACRTLYDFAWRELADWYLEATKVRLHGDDVDAASQKAAKQVLATVIDQLLTVLHPMMPFVTEELWRALTDAPGGEQSLMARSWPDAVGARDEEAEQAFELVQDLVTEMRRFRSANGISPSRTFPVTLASTKSDELSKHVDLVCKMAGLEGITITEALTEQPGTSRVAFSAGEVQVSLDGLIDVEAERERLDKQIAKAEGDVEAVGAKLENESFVANAPADVVAAQRAKHEQATQVLADMREQRARLGVQASDS